MKSIPPDELIHIIQHWINQDWPLTEEQAKQACRNLGWTENEEGKFDTPYEFEFNYVFLTFNSSAGELRGVDFWITDVLREESLERDILLNDVFSDYTTALKRQWGKPKMTKLKGSQQASWERLHSGCSVIISRRKKSLSCAIYSPEYAAIERHLSERGL